MMKKLLFLILLTSVLCLGAFAEGFFPSTDVLFGQAMPSLNVVVGRTPDEEQQTDEGTLVIYRKLSGAEYTAFSQYLAGTECALESSSMNDGVLTAVITRGDGRITFTYDNTAGMASILYPSGTRIEDAKQDAVKNGELLPDYLKAFGTGLPSMSPLVSVEPKQKALQDGGMCLTYSDVTEMQYDAFSRYLASCGCTLDALETEGGVVKASLSLGNVFFSFTYDSHTHSAEIEYPAFSYVEDTDAPVEGVESVLPLADEAFGVLMPRIALATDLKAGETIESENGFEENYEQFTDSEYEQFSRYLQEKGCEVTDYSTDAGGILTVNLVKSGVPFTLIYDRANSAATMRYPKNSRPEPTPTPMPTAKPQTTPAPQSPKKEATVFSESECWRTAEAYFKNMSWKNPDSLMIHSHTATLTDGAYTFLIDFSAQNGFGGYDRNTGMVVVDASTNMVTMAWAG